MAEEIIKVDDLSNGIRDYDVRELNAEQMPAYCSIVAETREEQAKVFNAANAPKEKVADHINKKIMVSDIYAETLELVNKETGEVECAPRIVLIDDKGVGYECVSVGMFSSLKKLIKSFGEPTWNPPLPCVVEQQKVANGSMLTIRVEY